MMPERTAEICKAIARAERETYDAWLARTLREHEEREAKMKDRTEPREMEKKEGKI